MPQTGQVALRQVSQERCQLAVPTLQQGLGSRHWRAAVPWTLVEQKAAGSNQLSFSIHHGEHLTVRIQVLHLIAMT